MRHQTVAVDGGHRRLVALELGLPGDVADDAVGVMGQHGDLLLLALRAQDAIVGDDVSFCRVGSLAVAERRALGDPAAQGLIVLAVGIEPPAAAVGHAGRRPWPGAGCSSGAAGKTRRPRASLTMAL